MAPGSLCSQRCEPELPGSMGGRLAARGLRRQNLGLRLPWAGLPTLFPASTPRKISFPGPQGGGPWLQESSSPVSALLTSGPLSLSFLLWILWLEDTQPESLSGRKWEKAVEGHP